VLLLGEKGFSHSCHLDTIHLVHTAWLLVSCHSDKAPLGKGCCSDEGNGLCLGGYGRPGSSGKPSTLNSDGRIHPLDDLGRDIETARVSDWIGLTVTHTMDRASARTGKLGGMIMIDSW
jgi:hypothetical protein